MSRVLVIANDAIGVRMAGPGIRSWEMAKALATEHAVTLLTPTQSEFQHQGITIEVAADKRMADLATVNDVVIGQAQILSRYPVLSRLPIVKVIDLYDPTPIGSLETRSVGSLENQMRVHHALVHDYHRYLRDGDLFLCASQRQWDYWVGMLAAVGRINPAVYVNDRMLEQLLMIVPYGIPHLPPRHDRQVLKGKWPGIEPDDIVVTWGGGLWEWLDPVAAVEAMDMVRTQRSNIKLFFMGVKRPNASVTTSQTAERTVARAGELGLTDRYVFFNEWAPYEERESYLCESDIGINVHRENIETSFSFRTRMMDYIWAGLPIVTTEGDPLSQLVRFKRLGLTVPCGNTGALAEALIQAADDVEGRKEWRENCFKVGREFTWQRVLQPLITWCQSPRPAQDKSYAKLWRPRMGGSGFSKLVSSYYLQRALHYYRVVGFRGAASQTMLWWWRR